MIPTSDRSAWLARNVLLHEPALRAWLRHRRVDGLEVDDIVQETYAVLASMASVDHIESPRAYAFQAARSVILRHIRRSRIVRIEALGPETLEAPADAPSPEQQTSARQDLRRVAALIASLPAKRREAFTLRKVEGLSQREVAQRMGVSENTVEKHIGHALRMLMAAMKHGGIQAAKGSEDQDFGASGAHGPRNRQGY
jgi:RNA polymerase sigma factor (sigma-70 family)